MTLVTWMQCCKTQGWLAFTSLLLFTLSILLKPLSNLRALVTQMQLLRDEACWHLSIILCIWVAWGKLIIITIHCIVKLCLYLLGSFIEPARRWRSSANPLSSGSITTAQQFITSKELSAGRRNSMSFRAWTSQTSWSLCPKKDGERVLFFFSLPKVGAHNRVPSKQLYYWVTEPIMVFSGI